MVSTPQNNHKQTYEPIASTSLNISNTSYTFSNIPSNFTDLIMIANVKNTANWYPRIMINGSTENLSRIFYRGDGTTVSSNALGDNYIVGGLLATTSFGFQSITNFFGYSNSTTFKTFSTKSFNGSGGADFLINTWRSTSPITSITYYMSANSMDVGTTISLYGIRAAT